MKYNTHLLLHIPKSVKDYGALWTWSAFPFEGYNYVLRKMLFSSQFVLGQICKSYLRLQKIKYTDIFKKPNCNTEGRKLFHNMVNINKCRYGQWQNDNNTSLRLFGLENTITLSLVEKLSIVALIGDNIEEHVKSYERFIHNKILYHGDMYDRMYKRNNSVVQIEKHREKLATIRRIAVVYLQNL